MAGYVQRRCSMRNSFIMAGLSLLILIALIFSGCSSKQIEHYLISKEELDAAEEKPVYQITLADNYLLIEKKNQARDAISIGLIKAAFPEIFDAYPLPAEVDDGWYLKKEVLQKIPGLTVRIDDQTIELTRGEVPDQRDLKSVNAHSDELRGYVFLVNQQYPLPEGYLNSDITLLQSPAITNYHNGMSFDKQAGLMLDRMGDDFYRIHGKKLINVSTYRTYEHQQRIFNSRIEMNRTRLGLSYEDAYKKASQIVAIPGTSEHQTGLAIDFTTQELLRQNRALVESFADTTDGRWLYENAAEYGFILSFPKGKSDITAIMYEPWHYRYVGLPHSLIIKELNLTLSEYLDKIEAEKSLVWDQNRIDYIDPDIWLIDQIAYAETDLRIESDNRGGFIMTRNGK